MSPQPTAPTYVFVLRDSAWKADLAAALGTKVAHATDFERAAPCFSQIGDALLLERLNIMVARAAPEDIAAIAKQPHFGKWVTTYRQARQGQFELEHVDGASVEPAMTWGLRETRVSTTQQTGRGVRVAVLDIALHDDHPDFRNRPTTFTESFTGAPPNASLSLHGTAVAGIVAGPAVPSAGPRYGVAPDCELYFGRVGNDNFSYEDPAVLCGLNWALCNHCRVANLSLGTKATEGALPDPVFEMACIAAAQQGMLVVAAGGNRSQRQSNRFAPVDQPANSSRALAVGAINLQGKVASFSPRGINGTSGGEVNLVAPGVLVHSARANHATELYAQFTLTSFATPFVTGIAALWLEKEPTLTTGELWNRLEQTARTIGPAIDAGHGLVQAP